VGGFSRSGKILVIADHSIFINNMMQLNDTGNAEFANRCINWLKGDNSERNEVLFYEDGQVKSLEIELKRLPALPPGVMLDMAQAVNQFLANAEEINLFDEILDNAIPPSWNRRTLRLLLFTSLVLACGMIGLGFARYRREPGALSLPNALAKSAS